MTQPISPDEGDALKACLTCKEPHQRVGKWCSMACHGIAIMGRDEARTDPPVAMDDVVAIREALDWAANFDPVLVDQIRERALLTLIKDSSK